MIFVVYRPALDIASLRTACLAVVWLDIGYMMSAPIRIKSRARETPGSQLPHPLREFELAEFPRIQQPLLAQIDVLHGRDILRGRFADATRYDDGVRLEDDAIVDDLVDGKGEDVVVFNQGSFIDGVPAREEEKWG